MLLTSIRRRCRAVAETAVALDAVLAGIQDEDLTAEQQARLLLALSRVERRLQDLADRAAADFSPASDVAAP